MPYVAHIRPMSQVGFRLMAGTSPARAAALSGIGSLGQNICLDQSQNTIPCNDPSCTYGDCGASGAQLTSGPLCLDQNQNQIACSDPNCTYGDCVSAPMPPGAGAAAPAAGVPTGTTLVYQAVVGARLFYDPSKMLSAVNGALANQGISVTASTSSMAGLSAVNYQLTLLITGAGFGKAQDVKAIIDGAFYQQMGQMPQSSNITVTGMPAGTPGAQGATQPPPTQSMTAFIEQNMTTILLGLGALVLLPAIVKKM